MTTEEKSEWSRKQQRWSQVANAGGFALRYAEPILEWLTVVTDSEKDAREILMYLVNRLSQKGFGEKAAGRLSDYLLKTTKRVAEAFYRQIHPEQVARIDRFVEHDALWKDLWSQHLLTRAKRGVERYQHAHPAAPLHTILNVWEAHGDDQPSNFSLRLKTEQGLKLATADVPRAIQAARKRLAKCLLDEVADTLTHPQPIDVMQEIQRLGLEAIGNPPSS